MDHTERTCLSAVTHDPAHARDQKLVAAALADRNAYGHVIAQYEAVLRRYVKRVLGHHSNAIDDVLQEVFIKSYMNLNDYDAERAFGPWIYRIAHNEAVSYLRKANITPQPLTTDDVNSLLDQIADPDNPAQLYWRSRSDAEVRSVLAKLDAKYREVLTLRFLEDQSYDEIADILHLPSGTVATLIRRGLERMRKAVKEMEATR